MKKRSFFYCLRIVYWKRPRDTQKIKTKKPSSTYFCNCYYFLAFALSGALWYFSCCADFDELGANQGKEWYICLEQNCIMLFYIKSTDLYFCIIVYTSGKIMSTHLVPHLQSQWWSWWWSKSKRHQRNSNPHNWWRDNCQCWGKWPNLQEPTLPLQYWLQCPWKPLDHPLLPLHHQKLIHLCIPRFCHLKKFVKVLFLGEKLEKRYLAFLHHLEAL